MGRDAPPRNSRHVLLWKSGGTEEDSAKEFSGFETGTYPATPPTAGLWQRLSFSTILPADYLKDGTLKIYVWNPNKSIICIDSARLQMEHAPMPKYLPQIKSGSTTEGQSET